MTKERRIAPRVSERVAMSITGAEAVVQTESKNISASGVYCTIDRFLAPMTKLDLQLDLPRPGRPVRLHCSGVVVRVEPVIANTEQAGYHVAIFFTELSERHRAAIARFVRQRLAARSST